MILPNSVFFREIENLIKEGDTVKIKLVGNSMFPFLRNCEDNVTLAPFKESDLKRGSVALFKYKNYYILHRLISIDNNVYTFSGDGNIGITEKVELKDIIAQMTLIERSSGKKCACDSFLWRLKSWLWLTLSPFRRYLLWICRKL